MRHLLLVALACVGCGKELNSKFCAAHSDDPRCTGETMADAATADGDNAFHVAHLSDATEAMFVSTADITVSGMGTVIDTQAGTITPEWTGAVILNDVPQDDGANVLVVQVHNLVLEEAAAILNVFGDRPLVIVATGTVTLSARLDVSANGHNPGSGGFNAGEGTGEAGVEGGTTGDGGGGGGSFQTKGGTGGDPGGGKEGKTYGAATRLEGGSGGGLPSKPGTCDVAPGGGGGAVQITAAVSITIDGMGRINVGGGGGAGGVACTTGGVDGSGGAGGGAGGMIYLQSPLLLGSSAGVLGALGGGGGEGASLGGTVAGDPGDDATTSTPGVGGSNTGSTGGEGGAGALDGGGVDADDPGGDNNGGGGGGGAGWIFYSTSGAAPAWTAHPPAISI